MRSAPPDLGPVAPVAVTRAGSSRPCRAAPARATAGACVRRRRRARAPRAARRARWSAGAQPAGVVTLGAAGRAGAEHPHEYWISGPRKDGADRLYVEPTPVEIDDDVREEYCTQICGRASRANDAVVNR